MRTFVRQNLFFFIALVAALAAALAAVFLVGFGEMLKSAPAATPERLGGITFPIWDRYPVFRHGFLVFLAPDDFEKGVAYSHHSTTYLIFMFALYKIESVFPQFTMRGVAAGLEMLFLAGTTSYLAFSGRTDRIDTRQAILFTLAMVFLATTPAFWISAGKFNVDNIANFLPPLLLILAFKLSRNEIQGAAFWVPCSIFCLTCPTFSAVLGFYIGVSAFTKKEKDNDILTLAARIVLLSILVYLQPVLTAKGLGFAISNSGWLFRSGLDGDMRYFSNAFSAVINPYFARPVSLILIPAALLALQCVVIWWGRTDRGAVSGNSSAEQLSFYGFLFSQYMLLVLFWPQAISIHPYLYDILLVAPLSASVALNFAQSEYLLRQTSFWIFAMLFLISFNLQQIAQAGRCGACSYPALVTQ